MALVGNVLYVADTENHLLRKVDLTSRRVTTIAGTGEKGSAWPEFRAVGEKPTQDGAVGREALKTTALASPWALWQHGNDLYIAMAGMHQIWKMPLDESTIGPYAGQRARGHRGWSAAARRCRMIAILVVCAAKRTYVGWQAAVCGRQRREHSAVGAVRRERQSGNARRPDWHAVRFRRTDGTGRDVRLQHPLGVAWADGKLYVADTYNNKIKVIDVEQRTCRTLAGTGKPGNADGDKGQPRDVQRAGRDFGGGRQVVCRGHE